MDDSTSRATHLLRAVALPCLLVAAIIVADLLEGPKTAYVGVLTVAPMLSAVFGTPRTAVAVGAVALTAAWLFGLQADDGQATAQTVRLVIIGLFTVLAAGAAAARVTRERRLAQADRVVAAVTRAVIRPLPPSLGGVGLAATYAGADADAHVGGDFYEVLQTPHGVRIVLGDVRGKGLEAVRLANYVLGAFRQAARSEASLADVVVALDELVGTEGDAEDFVTAVLLEVGPGGVVGITCGHPSPMVLAVDGVSSAALPRDLPLGLGAGGVAPGPVQADATGPTRLLLHSDGLIEARDPQGRFFDVGAALERLAGLDDPALVLALQDAVARHTRRRLRDDVALLCVTVPVAPAEPVEPAPGLTGPATARDDADVSRRS